MRLLWLILGMSWIGSWLTYGSKRGTWVNLAGMAILGSLCALTFAYGSGGMSKRKAYTFSLAYDAVILFSYTVLPMVFWKVKLNPMSLIGLVVVVIGIMLVKAGE